MSDEDGDKPPQTETASSGGDAAVKQEDQAPPVTDPQEGAVTGAVEPAQTKETAQSKPGEVADGDTAPTLTEPNAETALGAKAQTAETQTPETQADETQANETTADGTVPQAGEAPAEGGEQRPLPPELEQHVFDGEIKTDRDGDYYASGYHHREGGVDQGDFTVDESAVTPTDSHGVYEAEFSGTAPDGTEISKTSSFFPDSYSRDDVRGAVREAFDNRAESSSTNPRQWEGVAGDGMTIQGYVRPGTTVADATEDDIKTAYPVWEGRFLL